MARLKFTVGIDGPAAAGKGTISKGIARHFGFAHLDTGLLYRAVGRLYLNGAEPVAAAKALTAEDLQRDDLRTPEVAQAASKVSPDPAVRAQLVDFQREFASRDGGAVLDGRDIGTVICPTADVKLFVTARADVRAQRRFVELRAKGSDVTLDQVQSDVRERDARDSERDISPTRQADDAVLLDTSDMTVEDALAAAIAVVDGVYRATAEKN